MDTEQECHWAGFPSFLCGEAASYMVIMRALMLGDDDKIEEEFAVCTEHAVIMTHNAIVADFHVVARPLVPIRIEWADPED